jgi:hypothetical protein
MTDTTTTDTATGTSGQRTYDAVLADAIRVLTEAARRTITWTDRDGREHLDQADFVEFVTHAVAGAAANLGSVEAVLAGRPGSWEAHYLRQMLHSTVGYDEAYLLEHRSEPVVVRVHVDDILTDLGFWDLYEDAHAELERRYDAVGIPAAGGVLGAPDFETALAQLPPATREQQAAAEAILELQNRLDALQQREWSDYGEALRANVLTAATELFPGLRVPVEVIVELGWQNNLGLGEEMDWNGPVWRLWETARLATPLPGSGIPLRDYPTTAHTTVTRIERDAGRDPLARLENGEGQQ